MVLAQDDRLTQQFISISEQFAMRAKAYDSALRRARRPKSNRTQWLLFYLDCYKEALKTTRARCAEVSRVAKFWTVYREVAMSPRQRTMLSHYVDAASQSLRAREWAAIAAISIDTAERDLCDLLTKGVIARNWQRGKKNELSAHASQAMLENKYSSIRRPGVPTRREAARRPKMT